MKHVAVMLNRTQTLTIMVVLETEMYIRSQLSAFYYKPIKL